MKKIVFYLMITVLLLSCSTAPSEGKIETSIAGTLASMPTHTSPLPSNTSVPENTKIPASTNTYVPTTTPLPTKIPTERPTSTKPATLEDIRNDIEEILIDTLEKGDEIKRVNFLQFDGLGTLDIELMTIWASRDSQPNISYDVTIALAYLLTNNLETDKLIKLFGSDNPFVHLVTYSTDGDYRYESISSLDLLLRIVYKEITYEGWVSEANAGFK